jgi:hypothetical protein
MEFPTHMEFPEDVIGIISAFSKPMGRRDWKTCKQHESNVILWHNRYTQNHSWTVYSETRHMANEIASWTLHGRTTGKRMNWRHRVNVFWSFVFVYVFVYDRLLYQFYF